ncbi:MAG: TraB/GumN family protein [Muribaculaceae bacterium]|nr:TraB/GumN family protein [Muribaculaceae bacterium]
MNIRKLLTALLSLTLGMTGASAQLLWKVTGNGVKDATYLFGTHHLAPVSMLDSVAGFADAMASVSGVVGEIDMSAATDPANMQTIMTMSMAPADSLLTSLLTPAQTDSVDTVLARLTGGQLTVAGMARVKPATLATQLAMLQHMTDPVMAEAMASGQQLDTRVQQLAREAGKQVDGFETLEQQLQILMGAPLTEQAEALMETVRGCMDGSANEKVGKLNRAYLNRNLDSIAEIFFDPDQMTADEMKRLVTDRNLAWAEKLDTLMHERPVMVAVGCGHLPGDKGLIALLRRMGYTVEPAGRFAE